MFSLKKRRQHLLLGDYYNQQGVRLLIDGNFDSSVVRAPSDGLFMSVKDVNFSALGDAYFGFFGGGGAVSAANVEHAFKATAGGWLIIENGVALTPVFRTIATATAYDLAIVYDASLYAHYWIRAGTEDWRRVWISTYAATDATVFAEHFADGGTYTASTERFGYLGNNLMAADVVHSGSVAAGVTGNAPSGDMLWRYTATTRPSSGSILLNLRRKDASNYWQNEVVGSNGNHLLDEVLLGSSTNRLSGAAAVTNGEKITIRLIGNQVTLYSSNTQDGQYTTAQQLVDKPGYELNSLGTGGVVNDLRGYRVYARAASGAFGSEQVTNGTFDTDITGWNANGTPTTHEWSAGRLHVITDAGSEGSAKLFAVTPLNGYIQRSFDYEVVSGTLRLQKTGMPAIEALTGTGTYTDHYQESSGASTNLLIHASGAPAEFYLDNVSIKEVLFADDALGTLLEEVTA